jgi:hypothetical protein
VAVPVFCCFSISEKLYRKYCQNWTKQKPKFLFIWHKDGVHRRDRARPGGGHTIGWRGPTPGRARPGVGPQAPSDIAFPPINSLHRENPRAHTSIHEKYCKPPSSSTRVWEGPKALPGTLPERGIITRGLLHRHACLRSDAWVVHLGLWVHSSS